VAPTLQFLTYQMRIAELFMGKRLGDTVQERMLARGRMVGLYSALFGVPISVGLTGFPLGDTFRKAAIDNGYVVGDKWYSTAFNDGIPSMAIGAITGNYYDIADRLGPKGFDFFKDFYHVLSGDQTTQEALGAGFNLAVPTMSQFGHILYGMANGQGYQVTVSDWADLLKNVTSMRQGWKFFVAAKYGEWLSKNEGVESTNVNLFNAGFMALSGLQPQFQSDQFLKGQMIKEHEAFFKAMQNAYSKEVQRGVRAAQDGNTTLANTFFTNAQMYLTQLPPNRFAQAIKQAYSANVSVADKVDFSLLKNAYPEQTQTYLDAYDRQRKLRDQGIQ
jgi:hypothetical protein